MTIHNDRLCIAEFGNGRVSVLQLDDQFCSIIGLGNLNNDYLMM